jgi:hypothetical protein
MAGEMMMWTKKRPTSVVSIEWGYGFLSLEWVRKNGRQPHAQAKATVTLPADYLQQTPASLGAMVRQALESNGIREKQCLVTLPIGALFSARTEVPPLEEEDLQSFFDTQAEREFPFPLEGLRVSRAAFSGADGKSHVLMMALASQRLAVMSDILEQAGLVPLSWSLAQAGETFLRSLGEEHALCLMQTPSGFDLLAISGGSLVLARSLSESDQAHQLAREIKISLGELCPNMQRSIRTCLLSPGASAHPAIQQAMAQLSERLGMACREVSPQQPSLATCLAQDYFHGPSNPIEFLAPRPSRLEAWSQRFSDGRSKWIGGGAAAAILTVGLVFFWQGQTLQALEEQWAAMEDPVKELETLQERIRQYRGWFDSSIPTLQCIQHLTEAFPEEGEVWVKELDIRDHGVVSCSGLARSNRAWLDMLDKLRNSPQVKDLTVDQVRDDQQTQFSFRYRWEVAQP